MTILVKQQNGSFFRFLGTETLVRASNGEKIRMAIETALSRPAADLNDLGLFLASEFVPTPGKITTGGERFVQQPDLSVKQVFDEVDPPPPPPPPTLDDIYDFALQNEKVLKAVILAINDGTLAVGGNKTANQLKSIIKAKMS